MKETAAKVHIKMAVLNDVYLFYTKNNIHKLTHLFFASYTAGMLMRPAMCEAKAEARYHKAEAEFKAKTKKICKAEARDAILTINY